jgi:hypothetical protein
MKTLFWKQIDACYYVFGSEWKVSRWLKYLEEHYRFNTSMMFDVSTALEIRFSCRDTRTTVYQDWETSVALYRFWIFYDQSRKYRPFCSDRNRLNGLKEWVTARKGGGEWKQPLIVLQHQVCNRDVDGVCIFLHTNETIYLCIDVGFCGTLVYVYIESLRSEEPWCNASVSTYLTCCVLILHQINVEFVLTSTKNETTLRPLLQRIVARLAINHAGRADGWPRSSNLAFCLRVFPMMTFASSLLCAGPCLQHRLYTALHLSKNAKAISI